MERSVFCILFDILFPFAQENQQEYCTPYCAAKLETPVIKPAGIFSKLQSKAFKNILPHSANELLKYKY